MASLRAIIGSLQGSATSAPLQRWQALARDRGQMVKTANAVKGWTAKVGPRPPVDAQPLDAFNWLAKWPGNLSPVFAYPEWPWKISGDTATASYLLGPNDGVTWTATSDGQFHYDHSWGGTDIGQIADQVAQVAAVGADIMGLVPLGMFIHTVTAVANHEPIDQLGAALALDWKTLGDEWNLATNVEGYADLVPSLIFAIESGDWEKTWDQATNFGADVSGLVAAFAPGAAPDASGKMTLTAGPKPKLTTPTKGKTPMASIVLVNPLTPAQRATVAAKLEPAATALALKSPTPSTSNPQGGRTLFGVPLVDAAVGAAAIGGLAWLAKARHWF